MAEIKNLFCVFVPSPEQKPVRDGIRLDGTRRDSIPHAKLLFCFVMELDSLAKWSMYKHLSVNMQGSTVWVPPLIVRIFIKINN